MIENVMLNNDVAMPVVGLGTWQIRGRGAMDAVQSALQIGYRHIDTASIYGNEEAIGKAVRASDVPHSEVFITSKVWNSDHGYAQTLRACDASLRRLGLDAIDLYLIHWPSGGALLETWRALETLLADGRAQAIGVSNYGPQHLQDVLHNGDIVPAVNQIQLHPWNIQSQQETIELCKAHDIRVEAYTPLNKARRFGNPVLKEIAAKYDKSPAQVILRWDIQHGFVTIPKSDDPDHQRSNLDVFDFALSDEDMARIDSL